MFRLNSTEFLPIDEILSSLLQAEQVQLSQPVFKLKILQSLHHLSTLLMDLFQSIYVSLALGSPDMNQDFQMCLNSAEQRRRITSPNLQAQLTLMQPTMLLTFFAVKGTLLA